MNTDRRWRPVFHHRCLRVGGPQEMSVLSLRALCDTSPPFSPAAISETCPSSHAYSAAACVGPGYRLPDCFGKHAGAALCAQKTAGRGWLRSTALKERSGRTRAAPVFDIDAQHLPTMHQAVSVCRMPALDLSAKAATRERRLDFVANVRYREKSNASSRPAGGSLRSRYGSLLRCLPDATNITFHVMQLARHYPMLVLGVSAVIAEPTQCV
jgi:hypothetical protein